MATMPTHHGDAEAPYVRLDTVALLVQVRVDPLGLKEHKGERRSDIASRGPHQQAGHAAAERRALAGSNSKLPTPSTGTGEELQNLRQTAVWDLVPLAADEIVHKIVFLFQMRPIHSGRRMGQRFKRSRKDSTQTLCFR